MVFAGKNLGKVGPRRLALVGGITLGFGYMVAAIGGGTVFWAVLLGIGLIGGTGIGLAYVVPITVGMRWFPDRKGTITGLAVAGFGFGALGWVKLAGSWGNLIEAFSDKLGRKRSVVMMASSQGLFLLLFIPMAGTEWSLYLAAALIGFNFRRKLRSLPRIDVRRIR